MKLITVEEHYSSEAVNKEILRISVPLCREVNDEMAEKLLHIKE